MSIFGEFFRFLGNIVMGGGGSKEGFLEPLNMAERYQRWGEERGDLRDFNSSLEQLSKAIDEQAPKPDMILRKYEIFCKSTVGAARLMLRQHQEVVQGAASTREKMTSEKATVTSQLETAEKNVAKLTEEGSLITAKEEQRHVDEMKLRLKSLTRNLEGDAISSEVAASFEKLSAEADRLFGSLEGAIVGLDNNPELPADVVNKLREKVLGELEACRGEIDQASPARATEEDAGADEGEG